MAAEGAALICADLADAGPVADALAPLGSGHGHRALRLDVTDREAGRGRDRRRRRRLRPLDILCNNAGTSDSQPIVDATDESFRRQFEVNTWSTFIACRAAGRVMRDQRAGRIINTASQVGKIARPGFGVYAGSKAAVILMTQALALELAPYGVTANCICPGTMLTRMMVAQPRTSRPISASTWTPPSVATSTRTSRSDALGGPQTWGRWPLGWRPTTPPS